MVAFPFHGYIPEGPGAGWGVAQLFGSLEIFSFVSRGNDAAVKPLTFSTGIGNPGGVPAVPEPCADPRAGEGWVDAPSPWSPAGESHHFL